jgi:succinate dehydrogenase flavin-adding protein (antitoxin of CptAB toxin-antitoxin module)
MPKALEKYIETTLSKIGDDAKASYVEVIDEEAKEVFESIKKNTPKRTGRLLSSLTIKKVQKRNRYGYLILYEGYDPKGVPYEKIANTLNKGTQTIRATRHIRRAVRKLKGLDDRIYNRFIEKTKGK